MSALRLAYILRRNQSILPHFGKSISTKFNHSLHVRTIPELSSPAANGSGNVLLSRSFSLAKDQPNSLHGGNSYEFKAETRMLLDIVARSLYSEKEVFIRELISNASDALSKFRYKILSSGENQHEYEQVDRPLEIRLETNKLSHNLTIQDSGIGMTRDELVNNLGIIARSGSKQFIEELKNKAEAAESSSNIIGQFGVGFYSAFMVASKVEVFTRSSKKGSPGLKWSSDGAGSFEIEEADNVVVGTKIVIHLKDECQDYADEDKIKTIIKKYSNFVSSPIFLNGERVNELQALWLADPKNVSTEEYNEFYGYIANTFQKPKFQLHYKADVPLSIRALLFIPADKPGLPILSQSAESGVALYARKILIQSKAEKLLPNWMRFVTGVVDSEDIPLNLSRELLQNSAIIQKLQNVLTNRVIKFLQEKSVKEPFEYIEFYNNYSLFIKEGVIVTENQKDREEVAKLLQFNTNKLPNSEQRIALTEYVKQMPDDQKDIYYLAAPNRELAENSPYFEAFKLKNMTVLFCYDSYDELLLMQLRSFMGKSIISVEKGMRNDKNAADLSDLGPDSLQNAQISELTDWIKSQLSGKVADVKATNRLVDHPCVITVEDMAAARHFIRTQGQQIPEENRYALLQPQLELNPKHLLIKKLYELKSTDQELSILLVNQLFGNAMVDARLLTDSQFLIKSINQLLVKILEKR